MSERGVKNDKGKVDYSLEPTVALEEVMKVLTHGAQKYGRNNWQKGVEYSRYYSAARRHLVKWWEGENSDEETNLSHLAHAVCSLLFLLEYAHYEDADLMDDRPTGSLTKG